MFRTSGSPEARSAAPAHSAHPASSPARALGLLDEIVLEVHALTARFPPEERDRLGEPMRAESRGAIFELLAVRPAQAAHAATHAAHDPGPGPRAIAALDRLRYLLTLARRLGLLDVRRYRGLVARQDKAAEALRALPARPVGAPALLAPLDGESLSVRRPSE